MKYLSGILFAACFFGVVALIFGVIVWKIRRIHRAGSLQNLLLGGQVVHSYEELQGRPPNRFTNTVLQVHRIETQAGSAVGVLVTHSGPGFWRQSGFTLEPDRCRALVEQLRQAMQ